MSIFKKHFFNLFFILLLTPFSVFADCKGDGFTVVYINGIFTHSKGDADADLYALEEKFIQGGINTSNINFTTGYNASHLGGVGDLVESVSQAKGAPVSNFDRDTILMQIYPEIATKKILLVGHSQGTFYANEIYDYFIKHGESKDSVGVYNVATPASFVAGGGDYLTSSSDKVINAARSAAATKFGIALGAGQPLPANISIPLTEQEAADSNGGHSFSGVYLAGAAGRIISEIGSAINKLSAGNIFASPDAGCFTPPPQSFSYQAQKIAFIAADNIASGAVLAASAYAKTIALAVDGAQNAATAVLALGQSSSAAKPPPRVSENPPTAPEPQLAAKPPSGDAAAASSDLDVGRLSELSEEAEAQPPAAGRSAADDLPPFLQLTSAGASPGFGGGASGPISSPVPTNNAVEISTETPKPPDTTAPDISLSVLECPGLASVSGECLLASSTASVFWSSSAGDLNHYILECETGGAACPNFNFASTTATSTIYTLPADNANYIFKAKAVDNAGNESPQTAKTISLSTRPVVINEVAWAGTVASANDEWVELYNRSGENVNLANWVLYAEDGVPYINLSGAIPAGGYYLIERTDDNTVSDVAADLVAPFSGLGAGSGLGNSGEILVLSYASTTIDRTPNCGANWSYCGGAAASNYPTMERVDPEAAGTDAANWGTSNGVVKNGLDSAGAALTATPRARNSLHYLIAQGATLLSDRTLKKSFGTYIIPDNTALTIQSGKTLTIEPGVTVKMGSSADLVVDGTLKSDGTSADNILFTALSAAPAAGSWRNVRITPLSQKSSVSRTSFKYGGGFTTNIAPEQRALLSVIDNSITISDSIFEKSASAGVRLVTSNSTIQNNTFSAGTTTADNVGLYSVGGAPLVSGNTFLENYFGAKAEGAAASFADNIFNNNISYAVSSSNGSSTFSGNSGAGNGKNGIAISGTVSAAGGTTTLAANSLPYIISSPLGNAEVAAGSALVLEPGARVAGEDNLSRLSVNGTLKLEGGAPGDIVFTSLADSAPAEWYGIVVNSGGYIEGGGFTLRYGGRGAGGNPNAIAGIGVFGGRVDLRNALIQNNYLAGVRIYDSATSTLSNFEFIGHQTPTNNSTALIAFNSNVIFSNIIFTDNYATTSPPNLF